MRGVPHLQELHDKFSARGFKLVSVSSESASTIQKKLIDAKKATYGVVKANIRDVYSNPGIPHCWVLDEEGTCIFKGHPSGVTVEKVEKWLEFVAQPQISDDLGKDLEAAVEAYNGGEYGKAIKEATKVQEKAEDATNADKVLAVINRRIELSDKRVEVAKTAGDLVKAGVLLEELAAAFKGSDNGDEYAKNAKELVKSKEYKNAVKASEALEKLRVKLEYMSDKKAKSSLEKIIKKYGETKAGKEAAELVKDYE